MDSTRVDDKFKLAGNAWRAHVDTTLARMEALIETALAKQTRFFFVAWAALLAAFVGLYAR